MLKTLLPTRPDFLVVEKVVFRACTAMQSHRLHVLILIASFIIALRGLQVLQLFGVIPKLHKQPAACFHDPLPPFPVVLDDSTAVQQLVQWLESNGAAVDQVTVSSFDGSGRGLQV